MRATFVTFRGEPDVAVEYRDHGPDYDTNTHWIEWWISDPRFKDVDLTTEEEEAIDGRINSICTDPHADDGIEFREHYDG